VLTLQTAVLDLQMTSKNSIQRTLVSYYCNDVEQVHMIHTVVVQAITRDGKVCIKYNLSHLLCGACICTKYIGKNWCGMSGNGRG